MYKFLISSAFQVVHWATGTETLFDIPERYVTRR